MTRMFPLEEEALKTLANSRSTVMAGLDLAILDGRLQRAAVTTELAEHPGNQVPETLPLSGIVTS